MEPPARTPRLSVMMRARHRIAAAAMGGALLLSGCTAHQATSLRMVETPRPSQPLVAPPALSSSACGQEGLHAETTTRFVYLLSCSSGSLFDPPSVTVAVGSVVKIAGPSASQAQLSLPPDQDVARLDGHTVTGLAAGQVIVTSRGIDCVSNDASPPVSCPLLVINIR